jgi:predicted HD phosphohydrolase
MNAVVESIFTVFEREGAQQYLGEPVSMIEHMLQAAQAAEQDGAPPHLVAAALLHDYGHLVHGGPEDAAEHGIDTHHEDIAHDFLIEHFGDEIAEPIRLHVAAKRYLCAVEPSYLDQLSEASLLSLRLQGGPFSAEEVAAFDASPYAADAVASAATTTSASSRASRRPVSSTTGASSTRNCEVRRASKARSGCPRQAHTAGRIRSTHRSEPAVMLRNRLLDAERSAPVDRPRFRTDGAAHFAGCVTA